MRALWRCKSEIAAGMMCVRCVLTRWNVERCSARCCAVTVSTRRVLTDGCCKRRMDSMACRHIAPCARLLLLDHHHAKPKAAQLRKLLRLLEVSLCSIGIIEVLKWVGARRCEHNITLGLAARRMSSMRRQRNYQVTYKLACLQHGILSGFYVIACEVYVTD
jgi:hypothetical protein